jgi:predicted permease
VGLVLLLACANVASLLITQTWDRRRELAIRRAVGASRSRIVRQLMTEGLVLALIGGAIGVFVAAWTTDLIWVSQPGEMWQAPPFELALDRRVLAFALAASVLSGVVFTALPAARALRTDPMEALREQVRVASVGRRPRLRMALVVVQVAIAVVSVAGAGLFVQSLQTARHTDPGFDVRGAHVVPFTIPSDVGDPERERSYSRLLSAALEQPGVRAAALADGVPLHASLMRTVLEEREDGSHSTGGPIIDVLGVTSGYFETLGISLRSGRGFQRQGADGALQAMLSTEAARRLFGAQDPVGKRFRFIGFPISHEVVGVIADTKVRSLGEAPTPMIYVWLPEQRHPRTVMIVRADEDAEVGGGLRDALESVNPRLSIHAAEPLSKVVASSLWGARLGALLLAGFGAVALILAGIGIYGFAGFLADRRTKEIGIRMALGADPRRLIEMLMRESIMPVLLGIAIGLGVAYAAAQPLSDLVFDVSLRSPWIYLTGAGTILITAIIAAWVPVARAVRLDPMEALRR